MGILTNKTAIISGSSRGIGREIALKLASFGANIVLAAKTKQQHEFLEGTIDSVAHEVEQLGVRALPYQIDVRDANEIDRMLSQVLTTFSGVDILVNNAGAIYLTDTLHTEAKQFDLMHQVNVRATFLLSRACLPSLAQHGGHILNLSPPIKLETRWLSPHVAYTMSKFGMSMCTLGMAEEFRANKISVNSLWPRTLIYTAAVNRLLGPNSIKNCRKPAIMADAAGWILSQEPGKITGNCFIDEEVLARANFTNLEQYNCVDDARLIPDLYV